MLYSHLFCVKTPRVAARRAFDNAYAKPWHGIRSTHLSTRADVSFGSQLRLDEGGQTKYGFLYQRYIYIFT